MSQSWMSLLCSGPKRISHFISSQATQNQYQCIIPLKTRSMRVYISRWFVSLAHAWDRMMPSQLRDTWQQQEELLSKVWLFLHARRIVERVPEVLWSWLWGCFSLLSQVNKCQSSPPNTNEIFQYHLICWILKKFYFSFPMFKRMRLDLEVLFFHWEICWSKPRRIWPSRNPPVSSFARSGSDRCVVPRVLRTSSLCTSGTSVQDSLILSALLAFSWHCKK